MTLTVGSLFAGIGGLDLGLERAGMRVIWNAEVDPYCRRVLAKHWPDAPNLGDVTTIDWGNVERPDVICGGYPCQPFSVAGRRGGEHDPRHLWPYMHDAIRILRPRYALLENVAGHLSMGFGRVLGDLAELGYDAQWDCIPAAAVGAPHRRDRVFVAAYPNSDSETVGAGDAGQTGRMVPDPNGNGLRAQQVAVAGRSRPAIPIADGTERDVADADGVARSSTGQFGMFAGVEARRSVGGTHRRNRSSGGQWAVEPDVGRVAHGVPHRVDRLRGLGNAVVPQVAEHIGRMIVDAV